MKKKFICWMLILTLLVSFPATAMAADEPETSYRYGLPFESDNHDHEDGLAGQSTDILEYQRVTATLAEGDWTYYVNSDDTATLTDYLGNSATITTPTMIGGKNVTKIGTGAFEYMSGLTSVTISEGVTQLGDIESANIYGYTVLNGWVFTDCTSLTTISLPSTLQALGEGCFYGCTSLASFTFPAGNTNFRLDHGVLFSGAGDSVLEYYPSTKTDNTSYTIPPGVVTIAPYAISNNNSFQQITVPDSVTETYWGICELPNLTTVTINTGVTKIACFQYCTLLETVNTASTLEEYDKYAFYRCSSLTSVPQSTGLKRIKSNAFGSSGLTNAVIPATVDLIESDAFYNCKSLTNFNVNVANTHYKSDSGVLFTKDGKTLMMYPCGKSGSSYSVPSTTETIEIDAFFNVGLTQITLPQTLKKISDWAFAGNNLTKITIPQYVNHIGSGAFYYNPNLSQFIVHSNNVFYETYGEGYDQTFDGSFNVVLYGNAGSTTQTYASTFGIPFSTIPSRISLNMTRASMLNGTSGRLTATTTPTGGLVTWTSSNPSIITAEASGLLTAKATGTAKITATCLDKSASCSITVINPTPVTISCTKTDASVYGAANGSVTITASGGNSNTYEYSINGGSSWQSANTIEGLSAGTYTATARDALFTFNSATCDVTLGQPAFMGSVPAKKVSTKANAGTALIVTPPAPPKGYTLQSVTFTSSNPSVASVDASGNVTFLTGGKVTLITKVTSQMTDKKGKLKTKTTTVKKTITVKQPVASISLNLGDATIARTQKVKLIPGIAPGTASNKKLTWTSSNKKVATVSSSGVVTGKAGGTAVITCRAKDGSGVSASCTVNVTPIYPIGISLSKGRLTLKPGKTATLKATVLPKNTDFKTVTWSSSDSAIATVDAKGKVKGISAGIAIISATTSSGHIVICAVTVP